jgi:hypothetical protein
MTMKTADVWNVMTCRLIVSYVSEKFAAYIFSVKESKYPKVEEDDASQTLLTTFQIRKTAVFVDTEYLKPS